MALPKLNDVPKYTTRIPSTGKEITFRPFLVKEQKILLIALESKDQKAILQSIVDTIEHCVYENIDINSLATFDIEYIFTQIRSKSAGETSTVAIKCQSCEEFTEVVIPLDKIDIKVNRDAKLIQLTDQFTLSMRYPNYSHMVTVSELNTNTMTESLYEMAIVCLDTLMTEDEQINFSEEPREAIEEFLDNLLSEQFDKIIKFVTDLPKLQYDLDFECEHCNHENHQRLEGINDFF